jgi:hypothetical protein
MSSACWHTGKKTSLGAGSSSNSQTELRPQYARAGIWSGSEANRISLTGGHATAQALCAYASLGICWDGCLMRTSSFC